MKKRKPPEVQKWPELWWSFALDEPAITYPDHQWAHIQFDGKWRFIGWPRGFVNAEFICELKEPK